MIKILGTKVWIVDKLVNSFRTRKQRGILTINAILSISKTAPKVHLGELTI